MKIIRIKRKTKQEKYYSSAMGMLNSRVTYIRKYIFGFPIKTMYEYRETYYDEIKNRDDCNLYI
jgi:hypothetical protein